MAVKKITVYPDMRALAVLGTSAGNLNQAIECWASIIARATADNSNDFAAQEWCLIADVCNGTLWEPNIENPAVLLAAEVSDGHRLNGTGYRWFCDAKGEATKEMKAADNKVKALVEKLAALDYAHAWAVIVAVQWFWQNTERNIDVRAEPWWTLAYRNRSE